MRKKMQLETECARINAKSETISSQPCLSKDAIGKQSKEAEKNETANTPQVDAQTTKKKMEQTSVSSNSSTTVHHRHNACCTIIYHP